jgi:hypothetical protein
MLREPIFKSRSKVKRNYECLDILFLTNTTNNRTITAKNGGIIQVGNSGMVGVGEGLGDDVETG